MRRKILAVTISGLIASLAMPLNAAQASTSGVSLDQRVKRIERMLENPVLLQLSRRLGEQQREIQGLQDENDRLKRKIDQLKKTMDQRYADTDERFSKIEGIGTSSLEASETASLQPMPNTFGTATATLTPTLDTATKSGVGDETAETVKTEVAKEKSKPQAVSHKQIETPDDTASLKPAADLLEPVQTVKSDTAAVKVVDAIQQPIRTRPATADEKLQYKEAYALIKKSKYKQSINAFETFQANHPKSDLASNALYWAGEGYFVLSKHAQALESFLTVIERYPNSPKIPDATLRAGDAYDNLGDTKKSREMYNKIIKQRPNSRAAKNARKRLNR